MYSFIHPSWESTVKKVPKLILDRVQHDYETAIANDIVYPPIENIFAFTAMAPFENIRVIIIGQDPYHGEGQATGLAFSVNEGIAIPPSLKNIFKNQKKFKQITTIPSHGCLNAWATQGVLLINTALTVVNGKANSHKDLWKYFFDKLLSAITSQKENLIFVIFGGDAHSKLSYVENYDKHHYSISSHPSPLGASSTLKRDGKEYPCFNDCNHFGFINECIRNNNLGDEIDWNLV